MIDTFEYDSERSKATERSYLASDIVRQRARTLEILKPRLGEHIVDVGCGPGLLVQMLAAAVGPGGRVLGIDTSSAMLELADRRCARLPQVTLSEADISGLGVTSESVDAVVCAQVLLYVDGVEAALEQARRVLKPGGRLVIVETDWRGVVLNSADRELSDQIIAAWDLAVPNPDLPGRLVALLRRQGFHALNVEAYPLLSTAYEPEGFAVGALTGFAQLACQRGIVSRQQSADWLEALERLGGDGGFFFCVNRFLFSAAKP